MDTAQTIVVLIVAGGFALFALLVAFLIFKRGWKIPRPDEALIIVGRAKAGAGVHADDIEEDAAQAIKEERIEGLEFDIRTSACWVSPLTKRVFRLPLDSRSTEFDVKCHDQEKIEVNVKGVVLYKVGDNWPAMRAAARRFMNMSEGSLNQNIRDLVTGQVRALVGTMTIPELITERHTLIERVRDTTKDDMARLGLSIDSLTIQELSDDHEYIFNLGAPQAESVAREASVAADQARREKEQARQVAELDIAKAERDTEIERARYRAEQDRERETAAQAGPLSKAESERAVVAQQTEVEQLRVAMTEKQLDAEVRKRADADKYATERAAEAERTRALAVAEAEAEAIRRRGEAEAEAIRARGLAEAEAIAKRAQALSKNGQAVIDQQLVERMPEIAAAIAGPFGEIDNMVVLDGAEGFSKGVIGAITATGSAVQQIRGLRDTGNGYQRVNGHAPSAASSATGGGGSDGGDGDDDAGGDRSTLADLDPTGQLEAVLAEAAASGEAVEEVMHRIKADDQVRDAAERLAKHPERDQILESFGLSGRWRNAASTFLDLLDGTPKE